MFNTKTNHVVHATSTVRLLNSDSGPSNNIVRVNNNHMPYFRRWMPVCITNKENGTWIIRYVIGANRLKGLTLDSLGIDYDAQHDLKIKDRSDVNLTLQKATFWEIQKWLLRSPELNSRYGNYWGILGTILGIIGLIGMFF